MEALVVGLLTATTVAVGALFWQLLVRPEVLLSAWTEQGALSRDGWFEHHPGALRALRIAGGAIVFLLGFLTGLALTFLSGTGP